MSGSADFAKSWRDQVETTRALIQGEGRSINEHQTRRSVIDPMLDSLGWREELRNPFRQETIVKDSDGGVGFMDYLCIDAGTGAPRMVIEAKLWGHKPPRPSREMREELARCDARTLIYQGIIHLSKDNQDTAPLTDDWMSWLKQVRQYVSSLHNEYGQAPDRVAITNGRWLLTIKRPLSVFSDQAVIDSSNIDFFDEDAMFEAHDKIYQSLSALQLCLNWKEVISPDELSSYLQTKDVISEYKGVAVHLGDDIDPFGPKPQFKVWPVYLFLSSSGAIYKVLDSNLSATLGKTNTSNNDQVAIVNQHLRETDELASKLGMELEKWLGRGLSPSDLGRFTGFEPYSANPELGLHYTRKASLPHINSVIYFVATGTNGHFLDDVGLFQNCPFHSGDICRTKNVDWHAPVGMDVVEKFFHSGMAHFCGHRSIRGARLKSCHLRVIDHGLCCKSCIFQEICWNRDIKLPCTH